MARIVALVGALLVAVPLSAQVEQQLLGCRAISNDIARLGCFDSVADSLDGGGAVSSAASGEDGPGSWVIKADSNPLDDTRTVTALLPASDGRAGRSGVPVTLVLRCMGGETDAFIVWNDFLGTQGVEVTTRIGTEASETLSWSLSSDSSATFYPRDEQAFLIRLTAAERLVAQTTPYNESPNTVTFPLDGASEAVAQIRGACGW